MLRNISLRHLIPLLFFSGSLLLVVFFYLIGLPAAKHQATELSKRETHTMILTQQSRIIELLIEDEPQKLSKEIYFTSTDPTVQRMLIVDENRKVLFSNRSRLIGKQLEDVGIPIGDVAIPFPVRGTVDIIVERQPRSENLLNGYAALRFQRGGEQFNLTLIVVRDYGPLSHAITSVAAVPSELLATLMLALSVLAILLLRRHLDARLTPLLGAAQKLSQGDDKARANLKGADEFSEIGRSFDLMADRLERHHGELKEAKEDAEKASEAKNNFLGFMSHEIQTPLSGVLGFIDLLRETKLDEEASLYVRSAESAARNLSGLVGDLIESSRLDAGNVQTSAEVFCLNSLLQEMVDSILPRSMRKGLGIRIISNESDPIWIESDPRIFRQIIMNLLGNAVQFTERGKITIAVSVFPTGGSHIALSINVVDTGIGIDQQEITRLFERFYKSDDPRAQAAPGSGVGLSICRDLAEILGGKITVESELDQGSTFSFDVEVMKADPPNDFNYTFLAQREQKAQHVLLVENSEITRTLMRSILSKWGHKVQPCKNSIDAIQDMKDRLIYPDKEPITLVVMDLHMPGIDGFDAAEEIRGLNTRYARLPMIATSTQTGPEIRAKSDQAGFEGFINKPIDRKKMADEVFRVTRLSRERA